MEESDNNSSFSSDEEENFPMEASDDENFPMEVSDDENSSLSDTQLDSDSEKQKLCEEIAETSSVVDTEDRISKLPDSVIRHILSFITDTKAAARTCIVAKRWTNLWLSPSNDIDLDDSVPLCTENPVNLAAFAKFTEKVLVFHDDNNSNDKAVINKLRLNCLQEGYDPWHVSSWISIIADLVVKDLELCFGLDIMIDRLVLPPTLNRLPTSFFNHPHLVNMDLSHMMFSVPARVNFPCLKKLVLLCVKLLGDNAMKNLLSGCPVLRHLELTNASWLCDGKMTTTYIQSPTLSHLFMDWKLYDTKDAQRQTQRIVVEAPNIKLIRLGGNLEYDYDFGDLSSLNAFWLQADKDGLVLPGTNVLSDRMVALLEKVSHVQDLGFFQTSVRFLEHVSFENFPVFHNLKVLRVDISDYSWRILPLVLERSPNLVSFISYKVVVKGCEEPTRNPDECGWYPPHTVPKCVVSTLEDIVFVGFENNEDEIELIRYFLKNAMVLKKIKIASSNLSLETQASVLREIVMFPRSSSKCGILFF